MEPRSYEPVVKYVPPGASAADALSNSGRPDVFLLDGDLWVLQRQDPVAWTRQLLDAARAHDRASLVGFVRADGGEDARQAAIAPCVVVLGSPEAGKSFHALGDAGPDLLAEAGGVFYEKDEGYQGLRNPAAIVRHFARELKERYNFFVEVPGAGYVPSVGAPGGGGDTVGPDSVVPPERRDLSIYSSPPYQLSEAEFDALLERTRSGKPAETDE